MEMEATPAEVVKDLMKNENVDTAPPWIDGSFL
jgi:hypothetical protein